MHGWGIPIIEQKPWGSVRHYNNGQRQLWSTRGKKRSAPFDGGYYLTPNGEFVICFEESKHKQAYDENMDPLNWKEEFEQHA